MRSIPRNTHGDGLYSKDQFKSLGKGVVLEEGILVFHPEMISIGNDVYIGHNTILKGYFNNFLIIDDGTWIGQQCFFHSAGGIFIGKNIGIGPGVKIITSFHGEEGFEKPILHSKVVFAPVAIEDDADIGVGAIILPGVTIGKGAQIGAGSVVTKSIQVYGVAAGVPARIMRQRGKIG
jgi:acetyltransferase-like isoleucine patch superfamily enzyme